jgi:hypothetical protein
MSSSSNSRTAQNLSRETHVKAVVDALSGWRDEVNTMQAAETWQRNWGLGAVDVEFWLVKVPLARAPANVGSRRGLKIAGAYVLAPCSAFTPKLGRIRVL